jgi:thiol-disulfide isomerase/thioredoxin
VVGAIVAAVLLALVAAVVAGSAGDDEATTTSDSTLADGVTGDPAPVTVDGDALAPLPESGDDPAIGQVMPTIAGTSFEGTPLTVPAAGRPTLLLFVAHWCPHCQAEVPVVHQWVDEGGLPDGVDLMTVSTAVDARRGNYPPAAWLADEGWTSPVLADDADGSGATAAGLTSFPYFVAVDADGTVAARASGELTSDQLDRIVADLAVSAP